LPTFVWQNLVKIAKLVKIGKTWAKSPKIVIATLTPSRVAKSKRKYFVPGAYFSVVDSVVSL
jgi:hypothetical protein